MLNYTSYIYDKVFTKQRITKLETAFIFSAIALFVLHLVLIFANNIGVVGAGQLSTTLGTNYLTAIYTPFAILLLFEVFLLIISVPGPIAKSIGRQYEVAAIIVLWRLFKEGSRFEGIDQLANQSQVMLNVVADIVASLAMFALVALFYKVILHDKQAAEFEPNKMTGNYLCIKKLITMVLLTIFVLLTGYYGYEALQTIASGDVVNVFTIQEQLLTQLFTAMIFTDIIIVLMYYMLLDEFSGFFRNAAFIISTIFIRISIGAPLYYSIGFALLAPTIGIVASLIYKYFPEGDNDK